MFWNYILVCYQVLQQKNPAVLSLKVFFPLTPQSKLFSTKFKRLYLEWKNSKCKWKKLAMTINFTSETSDSFEKAHVILHGQMRQGK